VLPVEKGDGMLDLFKQSLTSQFEAGLSMLRDCVRQCSDAHWDGPIAKYPFWQVAYHTLCFVDLYLSPTRELFVFRSDLHPNGYDEFMEEYPSRRFERGELLAYAGICREKAVSAIGVETAQSLAGPSGFSWMKVTRAEMHIYNLRHLQHHVGALGAYLRRTEPSIDPQWVDAGWIS
jgi:hypothetical protein